MRCIASRSETNGVKFDESIKHLTNLHTLNLANTKVTDEGVKFLTKLKTLILWHTKITREIKVFLKNKGVTI